MPTERLERKPSMRSELQCVWHATALAAPALSRFAPGLATDVIVIGAGITGLSAALHLAEAGARSAVIDEHEPGSGTSGYANGQVLPGLHLGPDDLVALYGHARGEHMAQTSGTAPDAVFALIDRHKIECAPTRAGFVYVAHTRARLRKIQKLAEEWRQRGVDAVTLDRDATASILGTRTYLGGYFDPRAGTIHPLSYTRGLARAAIRAGASVFAGIRATSLQRSGDHWCLQTTQGPISARIIIIATNAYTSGLIGRLSRSILRVHGVQLATAPVPDAIRRTILPRWQSCSDNHASVRYFRWDPDGRFVFGGPGWLSPPRNADATSFRRLERSFRQMFPQLSAFDVPYRWFGAGAITFDTIPHLHEPRPGVIAALGYNGRGIAMGTVLGALAARRALGEASSTLPYPVTPLPVLPFNVGSGLRLVAAGRRAPFIRKKASVP